MIFSIYKRFNLEIVSEGGSWVVYKLGNGIKSRMHDIYIPNDVSSDGLVQYLDDIFHEYAVVGESIKKID